MMTFLTRRKPIFFALLLAATSVCSWADDGHDHGDAPAATAGTAKHRFTATSKSFELVGVVDGKNISLYLDHAADNRPVKDARLELTLGDTKLAVKPHGEGEFEATLAEELKPGEYAVTATVVAGPTTDRLSGDLDIHAEPHAEAAYGTSWKIYGAWLAGGLFILTLLTFALRRLSAQRNTRLGGAA